MAFNRRAFLQTGSNEAAPSTPEPVLTTSETA